MRLRYVAASALITCVRVFGNELDKAFVAPARDAVGMKPIQNEMHALAPERIVSKSVGWISLNEEAAGGMNSAVPGL